MDDLARDSAVDDALRQTHARFEAAIAAADVSVSNQDRELRYTWIHNPALIRAPGEVIGKRDGDLLERAEAGEAGGRIVAAGPPAEVSTNSESKTAAFLAAFMLPSAAARGCRT